MNTVSIYFFRLSAMAPGALNDCCILVPGDGESLSVEALSRDAKDTLCPLVVAPQTAKNMKLLHSPRYAPWLALSLTCPASQVLQTLELLAEGVFIGNLVADEYHHHPLMPCASCQ